MGTEEAAPDSVRVLLFSVAGKVAGSLMASLVEVG